MASERVDGVVAFVVPSSVVAGGRARVRAVAAKLALKRMRQKNFQAVKNRFIGFLGKLSPPHRLMAVCPLLAKEGESNVYTTIHIGQVGCGKN